MDHAVDWHGIPAKQFDPFPDLHLSHKLFLHAVDVHYARL